MREGKNFSRNSNLQQSILFCIEMDLTIRNYVLSKQFISKIAFNSTHNILAAIVDAADTIAFFHSHPQLHTIQEIFQGTSKPSGKKTSLAWSNDGQYLALGSGQLELWKFDGKKILPVKTYSEDFIDIKLIAWSPDSLSLAYGGLCKKNTIKIRHLQTGNAQEILIPLAISSISYDPFGKYLLLLVRNNILYVYNSNSLGKVNEVALSPKAETLENINTVKETRNMGWSPDFNYLVCPSLDDSRISLAINLCRSNSFKVQNVFYGHVSSISCAKFSPNLYEFEGQPTSIVAIGDSHGVVSLWRVGAKVYDKPLLICNSKEEYHEVVEELEWNQAGDTLFVNMMKRYINVLLFEKASFGREMTAQEKANLIEASYGVRSAFEMNKKSIEIFSGEIIADSSKMDLQSNLLTSPQNLESFLSSKPTLSSKAEQKPSVPFEPTPEVSFNQSKLSQKVEYVKVNEQITITGKNNRKKIQPAMLVRKDEIEKTATNSNQLQMINPGSNQSLTTINMMNCFEPLKLKPIQVEARIYRVSKNSYIQFKRIQGFTIIQLIESKQFQKMQVNQKVFTGVVDFIKVMSTKIYVLNAGNLYIFDFGLNMTELPYSLGDIHRIVMNDAGDIYYISTKGLIRGFNHVKTQCFTPAALPIQVLLQNIKNDQKVIVDQSQQMVEEKDQTYQKIIEEFAVEKDHNLYVTLNGYKNRYFYSRQTGSWISLQFNDGFLKAGHSLRVSEQEDKQMGDYFRSITSRLFQQSQPNEKTSSSQYTQSQIQTYQSNMIYYRRHNINKELYKENLLNLIKELRSKNHSSKLRNIIMKYLVDSSSEFYENDASLRAKVKALGGPVIQEFILFNQL